MSSIATFYLLPAERLDSLVERVRRPQRWWQRLFSAPAGFHAEPRKDALKEIDFEYSGHALLWLSTYLAMEGRSAFPQCLEPQTRRLCESTQTSVMAFDRAAALEKATELDALKLAPEALHEHLRAEQGEVDDLQIEAVEAALSSLRMWLRSVGADQVGLLVIG